MNAKKETVKKTTITTDEIKVGGECDKVKYVISRNGKKGKYILLCRYEGEWRTVAELIKEGVLCVYYSYLEGDKLEYAAKVGRYNLMINFGIDIPAAIKKAYDEGKSEEEKIKTEKEKAEADIVRGGRENYIKTAGEKAGKRFDAIKKRVDERTEIVK